MADTTPTKAAPTPAYAGVPRRSGLLYAIAGIVGLAALAAVAIFMLGGRGTVAPAPEPAPDVRAGDAQKSLDAAKAALDAASKSVLQPPATSLPPVATPTPGDPAPPVPPAAETGAPVAKATTPAPTSRPEPPRTAARPAPAVPPPSAKAPAPRPPEPAPAAPAQVAVANADRWAEMKSEMARCSSASVIPRIQCERRIRARYCDGYWGTVPDCPTSNPRS